METKSDSVNKYDFKTFRKKIEHRAPLNDKSFYGRWGYMRSNPVANDFTLDEIYEIIRSGDIDSLRSLSRYYYRTNSSYRNNIDFLSHLPLYDNVVIPVFQDGKSSDAQIIKTFYKACEFIERLDLPNTLARITTEWLITGIYNGILRNDGEKVTIQDLPIEYCRTRFKDFNNLNILEFNLQYFERINDKDMREEAVSTFPEIVQQAWKKYNLRKLKDPWVAIPPSVGGVCFCFAFDQIPALIASIPEIKELDNATKREAKRDENELYKLLIQRMPIDSKGQLVFQLEEVADIHASVADMLSNTDTVDVLTTFGETTLEKLQDSSNASQSNDRLEKYRKNTWNSLGRGEILFNAINSSTLAYNIKKDESLMIGYLNIYETWCKFLLNSLFARSNLKFDFEILPTTVFNRSDLQQSYFRGAQYGFSKMFAGVVMGIKQTDQLSLMTFENDLLDMSSKMVPLQSSYTTSNVSTSEEKNSTTVKKTVINTQAKDLNNTGGRPKLPDELKSEKTQANIESMG